MRQIVFLAFICIVTSCSEYLSSQENEHAFTIENINGFEVKLDAQLNADCKGLIVKVIESMVYVEGDCFLMGKNGDRTSDMPAHYVRVSDYYICKIELTSESFNTIMHTNKSYLSRDDWQVFIECINNFTGLTFDFPTEAQWEYAAKGGKQTKGYLYSGSNNLDEVRCSCNRNQLIQ